MNRTVQAAIAPAGLMLLAAALCCAILLEVSDQMPDSRPVSAAPGAATAPASRRPSLDAAQVSAWAATALARPVFSPSRRPLAVAASAPSTQPELPRVTGTMITPTTRRVIFAGENGKPVVVAEGGQLGAYRVTAVRAGQVVVSGPDGERTIRPAFDPKPPAAGASNGPAGPPAPAGLPGLPGFVLSGGGMGGVPGLTSPDTSPPRPAAR